MKSKTRQTKGTLSVKTSYGTVEKVPVISWKELVPYWHDICRAIFEVLIENDFHPYYATLKRPDGFVASSYYWKKSQKDPGKFPLSEARFFIYKLQEKPYFVNSIREFNRKTHTDWLDEKNIVILGGYLYSFFFTLKPVLKAVKKKSKSYLKPKMNKSRIQNSEPKLK